MKYWQAFVFSALLVVTTGCSADHPPAPKHNSDGSEHLLVQGTADARAACVNSRSDVVDPAKCVHHPFSGFRFILIEPDDTRPYRQGSHLTSTQQTEIWPSDAKKLQKAGLPSLKEIGASLK